ncbi:MAG: B12-binding domain-containing radical SAM protein [Candidatus Omnitrophica bacterium]|nr:B12-binding domain-containing radical SAM protein [Candidatus Omnitrophota bacterium]
MKVMFVVNDLGVNEPFGPMILSAILKEKGHETTLGVLKKEDVAGKIFSWKPDLLAYSMMSVDMKDMKNFNDALRKKTKIFTLLGGAHATLDRSCVKDEAIDAICVGEGDRAIINVTERLEAGKSLEGIPNILVSEDDALDLGNFIEDMDSLPFMDRDLVYSYPEMARFGIKGIWASRGCIFPCPYCFNNRYNELYRNKGRIVRRRSVDSIIKETKELISRHRVDFIRIQDDVFVNRADDWLKEFSEKWSSEIKKPFYCLLRSELVTEEMARYLKKAGCFSICMSIEAADDGIRMKMMRRKVTKKQLEAAFGIFKKHKINVYANTMLALPYTSLEHDIASLDFAIKVKPEMPNFSIFMPYPGTDLGDYCFEEGIYDSKEGFIDYGMRNKSPLNCFSEKEKNAQYNLCELAIVAVKLPFLRNLIVNHLIYWKPNKIFFLVHYLFAVSSYGRKIFYFKHTIPEYFELIIKTFKHYLYDFTKKEKPRAEYKQEKDKAQSSPFDPEKRKVKLRECLEAMANSSLYEKRKSGSCKDLKREK